MSHGAEFFTRECGELSSLRLSALRLAKYTHTPIGFFLRLPIDEFYEWIAVMNGEIQREEKEIKESMDDAKGGD